MINKLLKDEKTYVVLVIIASAVLRLLFLGDIPAGFFRDEAALGYNSYSLLKTGADEYGMKFPLVFRSFEVFFLPLYEYLTASIMAFLGMSRFSTRFLSAICGVVAVYIAYKIAETIWNKKVAIVTALVMAFVPWHIYFSRGAFEGNLGLTLFCGGFYFWIVFRQKHETKSLFYSTFFFALSMYSYQAERVVVFLFAFFALFLERKWILSNFKKVLSVAIFSIVILTPLISITFNAGGYHRAFEVSLFSNERIPHGYSEEIGERYYNNKPWLRFKEIASLYTSYFSPRNLFIQGDFDKQRSVENFSVVYPFLLPFLIIGIISLKRQKFSADLLLLILISPIPASLTGDPFHTYRSLLLYFPLTLLIGSGVVLSSEYFGKNIKYFYLTLGVIQLFYFLYFAFNYAILTQSTRARYWDYGYKEVVNTLNGLGPETKIVIDDLYTEPYILYLFFNKVDPQIYQKEVAKLGSLDNYYYSSSERIRPAKVGNVEFRRIDWPKERGDSGKIFVFYAPQLPDSEFAGDPKVETVKVIKYPDGSDAYKILRIK